MRKTKIFIIFLFFSLLLLPLVFTNLEKDYVSELDNRKLVEAPWDRENIDPLRYTKNFDNYLKDRIGFRSEMIYIYEISHYKLFDELVNPLYSQGEDGYIFPRFSENAEFGSYHVAFADMVKKIQDLCEERDTQFIFMFNPSKTTVLEKYVPDYVHYDNSWTTQFFELLDEREINYLDNTDLLIEKSQAGEMVYNIKYDANHWNDLGAYYACNAVLDKLNEAVPAVQVNCRDDFIIEEKVEPTLYKSNFPINDLVPVFYLKSEYYSLREEYNDQVARDPRFTYFEYFINPENIEKGVPKTLSFQGSYMNYHIGYKFFIEALGEYIGVHNYQNILNFEYYYNLFEPEIVVFEVAEYTIKNEYFNYQDMMEFITS